MTKPTLTTATILALTTLPLIAQDSRTGVSNPAPVTIEASSDETPSTSTAVPAKPSAGKPITEEVYGPYVPYPGAPGQPAAATVAAQPNDIDAEIVTSVPEVAGEIREGTLLRVRTREHLSTTETAPGTKFTAELMEPVSNSGRIVLPMGSIVEGQVTEARSGRRISGAAALHLEPRSITLPDGTMYVLHAQLIDTSFSSLNVDREGTLKRRDRAKETLALAALTTGGGAAAGALIGGGVGALVGAGIGAGATTVMWLKQERQATLAQDSRLVFSLTTPLILQPIHTFSSVGTPGAGPTLKTPSND